MANNGASQVRFAVLGEPIVAVDLVDTVAPPGSPVMADLLGDDDAVAAWWRHEKSRVPGGALPDTRALLRLRATLRELLEGLLDGITVPDTVLADLNFFTESVPVSTILLRTAAGLTTQIRWHEEYGGNPRLAFIAAQAAEFVSDPAKVSRLRRCANPLCQMIFVAVNPRRSWCASDICGNRARVARHYRRAGGT
jgi:predicted RNA-binding Zn ribbon-like protein